MDKVKIKITSDGSHTLELSTLNETYHSKHGAIQEARHVFLEAGLKHCALDSLRILEFGFGTGLNCILTLIEGRKLNKLIKYTGVEAFPLGAEIIDQLNYSTLLNLSKEDDSLFKQMHHVTWDKHTELSTDFELYKHKCAFQDLNDTAQFDLIYYDAFGPRVQPELWDEAMMEFLYSVTANNGVVVTYCAKGSVKRGLRSAGFEVETLPGPPGKREMIRATKFK